MRRLSLSLLMAAAAAVAPAATPAELLDAASCALDSLQLERARTLLDKASAPPPRSRGKKVQGAAAMTPQQARLEEQLRGRLAMASEMMERVEAVAVVDTFTVAAADFYRRYRLSAPSGTIIGPQDISVAHLPAHDAEGPAWLSEDSDRLVWTSTLPSGDHAVYEAWRLADGTWEAPQRLFTHTDMFGAPGRFFAPFCGADGVTLHFSADGPASLGGLDIFVTRRNADGQWLRPSNAGMPYNSPADDFLLAIDEPTGAGWWASTRATDGATARIYVYHPSEMRRNLPPDTPGLAQLAMLADTIAAPDPQERATVISAINAIPRGARRASARRPDFRIAMPDGRVLTHLTDFTSAQARRLMNTLIELDADMASRRAALDKLRRTAGADPAAIRSAEVRADDDRAWRRELVNEIVAAELSDDQ